MPLFAGTFCSCACKEAQHRPPKTKNAPEAITAHKSLQENLSDISRMLSAATSPSACPAPSLMEWIELDEVLLHKLVGCLVPPHVDDFVYKTRYLARHSLKSRTSPGTTLSTSGADSDS